MSSLVPLGIDRALQASESRRAQPNCLDAWLFVCFGFEYDSTVFGSAHVALQIMVWTLDNQVGPRLAMCARRYVHMASPWCSACRRGVSSPRALFGPANDVWADWVANNEICSMCRSQGWRSDLHQGDIVQALLWRHRGAQIFEQEIDIPDDVDLCIFIRRSGRVVHITCRRRMQLSQGSIWLEAN